MLILLVNHDNWSMLYQTAEETSAALLKDFCINFNSDAVDVNTVQTHSPVPEISTPIDNQICVVKTSITADDNIVRCICKDPRERGEMVCCDRCCVWQHVECIDIEISCIPDKYYCERCQLSPDLMSTTSISESVQCGGSDPHSTDVLLNTDGKTVKYPKSRRTSHKRKKVDIKSSNKRKNRNILMDAVDIVEESPDIEASYNCKLCGQNFKNNRVLQNHTRRHMSNTLCCELCDKMFKTTGELKRHGRIHSGEKPYVCDVCGKSFRFSSNLTAHIRMHTGKKPHKCDVCNKTFNTKTHLKTHKFVHSGEKPYKCDVCSKTFSKNNHLKEHMRIHTKQKPYSCDTCSKSFTTRGNLRKHIRIHSGEKPYKCDVCCKSFSQNGTLQKHVTIHTGQRLFICDVCGKTYKSSADLKQHQAVHSGDQPYKCNICCKSFFYSRYLETHRRSHSGERPFICDVCGKSFITNSHLHRHIKISCVK